jgi:branched-chain amino acid transport system substrate-binding protein
MRRVTIWKLTAALAAMAASAAASRAEEVKIGISASITGPFSIWGKEYKEGIDLFLDEIDGKAGNNTMSIIYRDVGGQNPPRARQLAQELVLRDKVAILGGHELTPNVLAVTDVINQAKLPFVIFNTGTAIVTDQSPYFVRPTYTNYTHYYPLGRYAGMQGLKKCVAVAADYAPGQDSVVAVSEGFKKEGGEVVDKIMIPLDATDYSSYLQRIKDASPECAFVFMPLGPSALAFVKAYLDRGLLKSGIKFFGQSETNEPDLAAIGDAGIGMITALSYAPSLDTPENKKFVTAFQAKYGADRVPDIINLAAYDAMHVVQKMAETVSGAPDGQKEVAAVKGMKWTSPRGPVSIDPGTREMALPVYIRELAKDSNGKLYNKVIYKFESQKEPWHELHKK